MAHCGSPGPSWWSLFSADFWQLPWNQPSKSQPKFSLRNSKHNTGKSTICAEEISPIRVTTAKWSLEGHGHCVLSSNAPCTWIHRFVSRELQDKEDQRPLLCTQRSLEISPTQHNLSSATSSKVQGMQRGLRQTTSPWTSSASCRPTGWVRLLLFLFLFVFF